MKAIERSFIIALFFIISISCVQVASAQKTPSPKETAIINALDSQRYVFQAEYASPTGGRQRYLTGEYSVTVLKDKVISYLPFFGRAYSAPINPSEGGIKFTSVEFGYNVTPLKKGGWDITIKPKDVRDVQQLTLSVFANGSANLQVTSTNRQPILFRGTVTPMKASEKVAKTD